MDDRLEAQKVTARDCDAKKEFLLREHLTIRLDDGPQRAEREWAARFVALSMGFPFRIEIGSPQTGSADSPVLSYSRKAGDGVTIQPSGYFDAASGEARPLEPAPTLAGAPVPFGSAALRPRARSVR